MRRLQVMAGIASAGLVAASLVMGAPAGAGASAIPAAVGAGEVTTRMLVGPDRQEANGDSDDPAISADGQFVVFTSKATNLVEGDTNGLSDVFVRNLMTQVTHRVSVSSGEEQAIGGGSSEGTISADGRFVAFTSKATNLVASDTNGTFDVFVRDRIEGVTQRVSVGQNGQQANGDSTQAAISADGRFVAFRSFASNMVDSDTNGTSDVFVRDRMAPQVTERVSVGQNGQQANGSSYSPAISAVGRFVAFASGASNLVGVGGDTNSLADVFVRDRMAPQVTERVSVNSSEQQTSGGSASFDPAISANGRYVLFTTFASNMVDSDTNNTFDVFMRDRTLTETNRISVGQKGQAKGGASSQGSISASGRYVAFTSLATNLVIPDTNGFADVFMRDRIGGVIQRVSDGSGA
jgi:Tol biopolymer transport system component